MKFTHHLHRQSANPHSPQNCAAVSVFSMVPTLPQQKPVADRGVGFHPLSPPTRLVTEVYKSVPSTTPTTGA